MNDSEKRVVGKMIAMYCRLKHLSSEKLCNECAELHAYAIQRLENCVYAEGKPTCGSCPVHCYNKEMRSRIKDVMRFTGPRMVFRHPLDTLSHFYKEYTRKKRFKNTWRKNRQT